MNTENGDESLKISNASDTSIPVEGGKKLILLCNNIRKEDIAIVFDDGSGDPMRRIVVKPSYIHHHCAVVLYSPPSMFRQNLVKGRVFVSLMRPSDGSVGPAIEMQFV